MIAETGRYALILALVVAVLQGCVPLIGMRGRDAVWTAFAARAAFVQFALIALSFGALVWLFVSSDFSLGVVAANSHSAKPLIYKIAGTWGNHEGSMLLWVFILAGFGAAFAAFDRSAADFRAAALALQGLIGFGFLLYVLFAADPFVRLDPAPIDGEGLNPLLQDIGLAFHPPLLYLGYVGASLGCCIALAALIEGTADAVWARALRPWALICWVFLTLGIGVGAWWSYYTLGWGGWWAWDPVENAALMPWLCVTALIHSLHAAEKRGALQIWSALLAILTFALSLVGTFLVRSGTVTSVHAFAADPMRGFFILVLSVVFVGGALTLFALRAGRFARKTAYAPVSRESGILFGNVLLAAAACAVLIGTLYPLAFEVLGRGKISVGPSYFDRMFAVQSVPLLLLMALGPHIAWRRGNLGEALRRLRLPLIAGIGAAAVLAAYLGRLGFAPVGLGVAVAVAASLLHAPSWGMRIAHFGVAVLLAGIVLSSSLQQEKTASLRPGDTLAISGYVLHFDGARQVTGANYDALRTDFSLRKNGRKIAAMHPELRAFENPPATKAETAIRTDGIGDLHLTLSGIDDGNTYELRALYAPAMPLVFLGMALMAGGGLVALITRRRASADEKQIPLLPGSPKVRFAALIGFAAVAGILGMALWRSQNPLPEPMAGRSVPSLVLPGLFGTEPVRLADIKGQKLVNVFASWCAPCRVEHPTLMALAKAGVPIIGIAYRDKPAGTKAMLNELGSPYVAVGLDEGCAGTELAVTGVPETLLIDETGTIVWRHAGPLDKAVVANELLPRLRGRR
jgi:cytochrome c-type biogenesis protein CcmF